MSEHLWLISRTCQVFGVAIFITACSEVDTPETTQLSLTDSFKVGQTWQCPATDASPPLTFVIRGLHPVAELYGAGSADLKAKQVAGVAVFAPENPANPVRIRGGFFPIADYALAACNPEPARQQPELPESVQQAYSDWFKSKGYFTESLPDLYQMVQQAAKKASK